MCARAAERSIAAIAMTTTPIEWVMIVRIAVVINTLTEMCDYDCFIGNHLGNGSCMIGKLK